MRCFNSTTRNEDIFLAGVEYLAKKYRVDKYDLITENGYHLSYEDDSELELKKRIIKMFKK